MHKSSPTLILWSHHNSQEVSILNLHLLKRKQTKVTLNFDEAENIGGKIFELVFIYRSSHMRNKPHHSRIA